MDLYLLNEFVIEGAVPFDFFPSRGSSLLSTCRARNIIGMYVCMLSVRFIIVDTVLYFCCYSMAESTPKEDIFDDIIMVEER